jgi:hypothetical protein
VPARARSLAVTDGYRRRLAKLSDVTGRSVAAAFTVDPDDLRRSGGTAVRRAAKTVAVAQRSAALLAAAYLADYVRSETGEREPVELDPDVYAGQTVDGRAVARPLASAVIAVRLGLARGKDERSARDWGRSRVERVARTEVVEAARAAQRDGMETSERITGWRRAAGAGACGACLAAATGAVRATDEIPEAHAFCRCVAEPVVAGVPERARRRTGEEMFRALPAAEQDKLFEGRGGAAKAELIRSGAVPLSALLTRERRPEWRDTITETTLAALAAQI